MYRCRIGSFNSSLKSNGTTGKSTAPADTFNKKPFLFLLLALGIFFTVGSVGAFIAMAPHASHFPVTVYSPAYSSSLHQQHFPTILQVPAILIVQHLTVGYRQPPSSTLPSTSPWKLPLQWPAVPVASRWRGLQSIGAWGVDPPIQVTHCSFTTINVQKNNIFSLNKEPTLLQECHPIPRPMPPTRSSTSCPPQTNSLQEWPPVWPPSTSSPICPLLSLLPLTAFQPNQNLIVPSSWLTARQRNSLAKSENGNRAQRGRGIKLIAWNKGPSLLHNKHQEIETLIAEHTPHVLGLSEANLRSSSDLSMVQHTDYNLHIAPTSTNPSLGTSRVVVYTHSSLVVKRRSDLEDDKVSAIWLELGLPRYKKIFVANIYREWQYMGQETRESGTVLAQLERWSAFISNWENAFNEGKEVIVLGDINLDFLKLANTELPSNDSSRRLKPLTELLFSRIFPLGVSQLVQGVTHAWPGQQGAGLDYIYTKKPEKCSQIYAEYTGGSDHKLLKVTRFTRSFKSSVRYVRKRSFKNFDPGKFKEAVKKISWFDLYMCDNPNEAAVLLEKKLTDILDSMAPIKTIQVRVKYAAWLSENTKKLIKEREAAQKKSCKH